MALINDNSVVTISFIGKLDNGEVFAEKSATEPFQVTLGNSDLPPSVETEIKRMNIGDTVKVRVPPEEGYGPRLKMLLQEIKNKEFLERVKPKPGSIITLNVDKDGEQVPVPATVIEVKDDVVVVDYNHPLAGHHLTYEITLLGVE